MWNINVALCVENTAIIDSTSDQIVAASVHL